MSSVVRGSAPLPLGFWKSASAAGAAAITPNSFADLGAWWKADSITGLNNNDPVSTWNDSNGANHFSGSGTSRPLWLSNASGGMPGVKFDAINDEMSMASILTLTATSWTLITVLIGGGGGCQFGQSGVNMLMQSGPGVSFYNPSDGTTPGADAFSTSNANLCVAVVRSSYSGGYHITFRENKTARGDRAVGSFNYTFSRLCHYNQNTVWGGQTFCEIIVYNRPLSDADCDSLYDGYLKPKYSALP
jgi:hypothetical protein